MHFGEIIKMDKYFLHDPEGDGFESFKTLEAAEKAAQEAIEGYLCDGWSEEVENVVVGKITHCATQTDRVDRPPADEIDEDGLDHSSDWWDSDWDYKCNYRLKPVAAIDEQLLEKSWRCFSDSRPEEAEGNVVLGFGSEGIQEYEYQDEVWCCITGDTMTHWMPMIESPLQAS